MIIPWLRGFLSWNKAPIAWMLLLFNVFIFILTHPLDLRLEKSTSSLFEKNEDLILTGEMYFQWKNIFLNQHVATDASKNTNSIFESHLDFFNMKRSQQLLLGAQALRDPDFAKQYYQFSFSGDQVAIGNWKKQMNLYYDKLSNRQASILGLSFQHSWPTWITYQFMHASWMHLIGNMVMLLIFASAVEIMLGNILSGLGVVVIYLLGGVSGAAFFIWLGSPSLTPMVGASGSLSAVMSFYILAENRKRVPFYYFISPISGFFGWIYLPTWLIFPLCFLPDLVGYLSTPSQFGAGVAYTAHLGGAVAGILMALLYQFIRSVQNRDELYSR